MLLAFRFSNHASINAQQELSLVASSLSDTESGLLKSPAIAERVLPTAVIYGANASGKSNVVDAFKCFHSMVRTSHTNEPSDEIPRKPFLLDSTAATAPSRFEADFILEKVRYQYGFAVSGKEVEEEWLVAFPKGRPQRLFRRRKGTFEFSRLLKGRSKVISELTRPQSLFVSTGAQNDHGLLSLISAFIRSWRFNAPADSDDTPFFTKESVDPRVIEFLTRMGTGVTSSKKRTLEEWMSEHKNFTDSLARDIERQVLFPAQPPHLIELGHRGRDGREVFLPFFKESDGTRRLLLLLSEAFEARDRGRLLIVDELDASLHTEVCAEVLAVFSDRGMNKKGAQLIATTHDTNLLSSPLLRRDQMWFVSKDDGGASHLYPLTDIRTRKGDNIEKGYLEGRFGATPLRP